MASSRRDASVVLNFGRNCSVLDFPRCSLCGFEKVRLMWLDYILILSTCQVSKDAVWSMSPYKVSAAIRPINVAESTHVNPYVTSHEHLMRIGQHDRFVLACFDLAEL